MTAMPPTIGHLRLVQFANLLADEGVVVILSTQPGEPMATQRVQALTAAIKNNGLTRVEVRHHHKKIPQDPTTPGFWGMWQAILKDNGVTSKDYIVASEGYGQKVAEISGSKFFPYDTKRDIIKIKATAIRDDALNHFDEMLEEFRPYMRTTVTIFGAESTGKTTLSKQLAKELEASWIFEYARPYLENTINEITPRSMTAIWKGQAALQRHISNISTKPYIIQDTDLFSTVGYWQFPHWKKDLGNCPNGLIKDAIDLKSDLYIVTKSNIPFEKDPLRYGGDKREGSDQYWINICRKYQLPYIVLDDTDPKSRLIKSSKAVIDIAKQKSLTISYDRMGF